MRCISILLFFLISLRLLAQQPKLVLPIGHTDDLGYMAFSPDGTMLVTTSFDKNAKLWDVQSGKLLADLKTKMSYDNFAVQNREGHLEWQKPHARFSEDGGKVAVIYKEQGRDLGGVDIWDVKRGKLLRTIKPSVYGYEEEVQDAIFDHSGNSILISTKEDGLWLYNIKTGLVTDTLFSDTPKASLVFSPDDKNVVLSGRGLTLLNLQTNKITYENYDSADFAIYVNKGKNVLSFQKNISRPILRDAKKGAFLKFLDSSIFSRKYDYEFGDIPYHLERYSQNGKYLLFIIGSPEFELWETDGPSLKFQKKIPMPKGTKLLDAYVTNDGIVKISYLTDTSLLIVDLGKNLSQYEIKPGNNKEISSTLLNPDGKGLTIGIEDRNIWNWEFNSNFLSPKYKGHVPYSRFSAYDEQKKKLTFFSDSTISIWDLESAQPRMLKPTLSTLNSDYPASNSITDVVFSPDQTLFGVLTYDTIVSIMDVKTGMNQFSLVGHTEWISSLSFRPDGREILTASYDGTIRTWDAKNGQALSTFRLFPRNQRERLYSVYSSDPEIVETTFSYDSVLLLNMKSGSLSRTIKADTLTAVEITSNSIDGHTGRINSVKFNENRTLIITSSDDNTARVWDSKTGKLIWTLEGHTSFVKDAFFTGDGKYAISFSKDNTIRQWSLETGKLIVSFFTVDDQYFFNLIPSGYYFSSPEAAKLLHYVTPDLKVITFDQLDVKYNRPDKVLEAIGCPDTALIRSYKKAWEKRIRKLGIDTASFRDGYSVPVTSIVNSSTIANQSDRSSVSLHIKGGDNTYTLDRFNVWVNDVPVYGLKGISIKNLNKKTFDTTLNIILDQGENRIETSVMNVNGTESYRSPLFIRYTPEVKKAEKVYFIGIGINNFANPSYNLTWSVKDIKDLAFKLREHYRDALTIDTLFNERVTRENVIALKQRLKELTEDDKVIVSYSGHGVLSKDYEYFLSTYPINFEKPGEKGLPYDDLEALMDGIRPRKKLMLIDACHSGELDKEEIAKIEMSKKTLDSTGITHKSEITIVPKKSLGIANSFELMQSLFVNVSKGTGATIISAAGGMQYAQERGELKNGVFTYSILEAFANNNTLTVSQLKRIVGERVTSLTNGLQKPTSRNETINVDWRVW